MRFKSGKKYISCFICMMLIAIMTCVSAGCGTDGDSQPQTKAQENEASDISVLGKGEKTFPFAVVDRDGNETDFEIHTDKETVGEALSELGMIEGEEGEYGIYVNTVNGITADYDADKTYWAFYVNGEYALSGVDSTVIEEGAEYAFKIEK